MGKSSKGRFHVCAELVKDTTQDQPFTQGEEIDKAFWILQVKAIEDGQHDKREVRQTNIEQWLIFNNNYCSFGSRNQNYGSEYRERSCRNFEIHRFLEEMYTEYVCLIKHYMREIIIFDRSMHTTGHAATEFKHLSMYSHVSGYLMLEKVSLFFTDHNSLQKCFQKDESIKYNSNVDYIHSLHKERLQ